MRCGGAEAERRSAGDPRGGMPCWPRAGAAGGSRAGAWRAARENNAAGQPGADSRAGGAGGSAGRSAGACVPAHAAQMPAHTRKRDLLFFNTQLCYARCPDLSWIPIVPELVEAMLVVDDERQEQTVAARDCSHKMCISLWMNSIARTVSAIRIRHMFSRGILSPCEKGHDVTAREREVRYPGQCLGKNSKASQCMQWLLAASANEFLSAIQLQHAPPHVPT